MRIARERATSLVAALALLAAACNGLASTSAQSPSPAPAPPTGSASHGPNPTETPVPTVTSAPPLQDGRHFVFVNNVRTAEGAETLTFDLAYFLTGGAAVQAAIAHGVIEPGDPLPNDYYIVNDNPLLRTVPVSPDVSVRVIDWKHCCDVTDATFADWAAAVRRGPTPEYHGADSPYWITSRGGVIVKIEEQYLP